MEDPRVDSRAYWRAMLRLVSALLLIWFASSFLLGIVLVEPLNSIRIGGFPLGFWFAQQGAIYIFVVLIFVYAWQADRLARRYGVD
jgi:putative solute:sodium symporter small subunit